MARYRGFVDADSFVRGPLGAQGPFMHGELHTTEQVSAAYPAFFFSSYPTACYVVSDPMLDTPQMDTGKKAAPAVLFYAVDNRVLYPGFTLPRSEE